MTESLAERVAELRNVSNNLYRITEMEAVEAVHIGLMSASGVSPVRSLAFYLQALCMALDSIADDIEAVA